MPEIASKDGVIKESLSVRPPQSTPPSAQYQSQIQKKHSQMEFSVEKEWERLLETKLALFQSQRCEHILSVFDEVTFRAHFENICKDHNQSDTTILFSQLQISLLCTEAFRELLSNINIKFEGRGPTELFWGGCFATLEVS